jgi:hypothetical protein
MSSQFVLADPDADDYCDYLNFGQEAPAESSSTVDADGWDDAAFHAAKSSVKPKRGKAKKAPKSKLLHMDLDVEDLIPDYQPSAAGNVFMDEDDNYDRMPARKIPAKQVEEHQNLMLTLQRYNASERFSPMLKQAGLKLNNLESKTVAELKTLQTRVRTVCSSGGGASGMLGAGILTSCSIIEAKCPKRILNLDGYAASLHADPEFHAVAEMLELDMGFGTSMSPLQRMGLVLGKQAFAVNSMNRKREEMLNRLQQQQQQQQQAAPVPSSIVPPKGASDIASSKPPQAAEPRPGSMYD